VDFKNTLLIMTSNVGSSVIEKGGGQLGFQLDVDQVCIADHAATFKSGSQSMRLMVQRVASMLLLLLVLEHCHLVVAGGQQLQQDQDAGERGAEAVLPPRVPQPSGALLHQPWPLTHCICTFREYVACYLPGHVHSANTMGTS
jgi:hypothetical protein